MAEPAAILNDRHPDPNPFESPKLLNEDLYGPQQGIYLRYISGLKLLKLLNVL